MIGLYIGLSIKANGWVPTLDPYSRSEIDYCGPCKRYFIEIDKCPLRIPFIPTSQSTVPFVDLPPVLL